MHSTETINQFLYLRVQGWSFARIADHLRVSKPTLLDWNRKYHSRLASIKAKQEYSLQQTVQVSEQSELQNLAMFYNALRRELVSRTLKEFSSDEIQALACDIKQQIDNVTGQELGPSSVALLAKEGPTQPALGSAFGEGGSNPACPPKRIWRRRVKPSQTQSNQIQANPATPPPPGKVSVKKR
jgi:hypothetical protein